MVTLLPSPAHAAWTCQDGWICFYQNLNATGSAAVLKEINIRSGAFTGYAADFRNYTYTNGANLNDTVSSVVNHSDADLLIFQDVNFVHARVLIRRNSGTTNLNNVQVFGNWGQVTEDQSIDNRVSSAEAGTCSEKYCF